MNFNSIMENISDSNYIFARMLSRWYFISIVQWSESCFDQTVRESTLRKKKERINSCRSLWRCLWTASVSEWTNFVYSEQYLMLVQHHLSQVVSCQSRSMKCSLSWTLSTRATIILHPPDRQGNNYLCLFSLLLLPFNFP